MNTESRPDSAVDLHHFDRFRTNPAGLRVLIQSFLSTAPDILQELRQHVRRRDEENVKNLLHTLTGSALSTGAVTLAETCKRLAREWEGSGAPSALSLESLQSEVEQARDALQGFLDALPVGETPSPPAPGARPFTILLVEDNVSARAWVRLTLAEDRFALLEAANGREALLLAERESLDLAIVDLNLGHPGPDSPSGFKLLQLFKNRVPTLVLTVDQRPQSIQRAIEAGAWGYLVKSPDPQSLRATVEVVLARSREAWEEASSSPLDMATGWLMATFQLDQAVARRAIIGFAAEQRRRTLEVAQDILAAQHFQNCLGRFIARTTTDPTRLTP